jgi:hypothetical protein
MKFLKFFLLLWVIFAFLDPDPDSEYGSGSTDPIESGSKWDPDPIGIRIWIRNPVLNNMQMSSIMKLFSFKGLVWCIQASGQSGGPVAGS